MTPFHAKKHTRQQRSVRIPEVKLVTHGTASRLLVRGKIRLPKVEHPKSEGHVTPIEDKYQKSVQLQCRHCLEVL